MKSRRKTKVYSNEKQMPIKKEFISINSKVDMDKRTHTLGAKALSF